MDLDRAMEYVEFVAERHHIWERRQAGEPGPWTTDPVLATKKFTNVFRVLDHDSQWIMRWLVTPSAADDPRDLLMRLFLFRHTGRLESWEWLFTNFGVPDHEDLDMVLAMWKRYRGASRPSSSGPTHKGGKSSITRVFEKPMFTSAYLVFPQSQVPGTDKLTSIIELTRRLFDPSSPDDVMPDFLAARTQAERFAVLRRNKGVADFMSMQILTDWGYAHGTPELEDEFIVLGPGARKGIREVYAREAPEDLLRARRMLGDSTPTLDLGNGQRREPSLMDLQNTFCEFSKYVRGPRASSYTGRHQPAAPVYPTHWRKQ